MVDSEQTGPKLESLCIFYHYNYGAVIEIIEALEAQSDISSAGAYIKRSISSNEISIMVFLKDGNTNIKDHWNAVQYFADLGKRIGLSIEKRGFNDKENYQIGLIAKSCLETIVSPTGDIVPNEMKPGLIWTYFVVPKKIN